MSFRGSDSDEKSINFIERIYYVFRSLNRSAHFEMTF